MNQVKIFKYIGISIAGILFYMFGALFLYDSLIYNLIIWSILLVILNLVIVALIIKKSKNKTDLPHYNFKNQNVVKIKMLPFRAILLGLILLFFGVFFGYMFIDTLGWFLTRLIFLMKLRC